jgi:O-antigen ligase
VFNLIALGLLWGVGVIISDVYNDTDSVDALKGLFNVLLLISIVPGVYWAVKDSPKSILVFWFGAGLSAIINFAFFAEIENVEDEDVWMVYALYVLVIAIAGYLYYKGYLYYSCIISEAFSVWSLFHFSRNIFLCVTIANIIILYIEKLQANSVIDMISTFRNKILLLIVSIFIGGVLVDTIYEYGAQSGYMGERVYDKYMMQKQSNMGLASGRMDFIIAADLIKESPIVGYGSYAKDKTGLLYKYYAMDEYVDMMFRAERESQLPAHSYVLGAWLNSGVLGLFFFIYVLYYMTRSILRGTIMYERRFIALQILLTMYYFWDILFSPFQNRTNFLMYIIPIIILNTEYKIKVKPKDE